MSEQVDATRVAGPPANLIVGVVKAMRPRQWVKNILVAAAPLAALGTDVHHDWTKVLVKVAVAFVVFCLAASSIYLVNDVRDVEADRQHPTKRFRPIAAGIVPEWLAYTLAAVLGVISLHHRVGGQPKSGAGDGRVHRRCSWPTASGSNIKR